MNDYREVIFIAAENGALSGGKVGGVADVVRDLPAALHDHGWIATVIIPAYGVLHDVPAAKQIAVIKVPFAGELEPVTFWQVPGSFDTVRNLVIEHRLFNANVPGQIYFGDETGRPYATDANKFAFLCAAVAEWLINEESLPDAIHLHDWHAAFYLLLRNYSPRHAMLRSIRTVFTIHNLSYQGTRPLRGDSSALESWFPIMDYDLDAVQDPVYRDCINPMATAIRLADKVSTVSPTYAKEICQPSNPASSFVGGEGLESLLQEAGQSGRLSGVLNGCYYDQSTVTLTWPAFLSAMQEQVDAWSTRSEPSRAQEIAKQRLQQLTKKKPKTILASIGRLVAQKATLFEADGGSGMPALEELARGLSDNELIIILGSGAPEYEKTVLEIAERNDKVLFLHGYSESIAEPLYELADLFLMPSSFEPCGISQLLAMRSGLPCVVHGVGGLKDTVEHEVTGFVFGGDDLTSQARGFVETTLDALELRRKKPAAWKAIQGRAKQQRFEWSDSAQLAIKTLYAKSEENHECA